MKLKASEFSIADLADSSEFAEFARIVRSLTPIKSMGVYTPDGQTVKRFFYEDSNPLCQLVHAQPSTVTRACTATQMFYAKLADQRHNGLAFPCPLGFVDFVIPIYIQGGFFGFISCGQILAEPPCEANFVKVLDVLKDAPVDVMKLRDAYFSSPYLPQPQVNDLAKLFSFFAHYLSEMGRRLKTAAADTSDKVIARAQEYIRLNFCHPIDRNAVAEAVALCPSYFSRRFARVTGRTFTDYLAFLRLEKAKRLLEATDWSVTQIAFAVGFGSLTYFNRVFKSVTKRTPLEYRARFKKLSRAR